MTVITRSPLSVATNVRYRRLHIRWSCGEKFLQIRFLRVRLSTTRRQHERKYWNQQNNVL